jgi:hypothetical protein
VLRLDAGGVAGERAQLGARGYVPDLDRVICSCRCEQLAVTTKRDFADAAAMTFNRAKLATSAHVPKLNLAHRFNFEILHRVIRIRCR